MTALGETSVTKLPAAAREGFLKAWSGRPWARNVAQAEEANAATHVKYKFWKAEEVNGRTVYQRDDIFPLSKENIQQMQKGRAPNGYDGEPIDLHHLLQKEPGAMAEVPKTLHDKLPHKQINPGESFRQNPALDQQFKDYKHNYWKVRLENLYDL